MHYSAKRFGYRKEDAYIYGVEQLSATIK